MSTEAHIPSRGQHILDKTICALTGHEPRRGANGWQNFGTGIFCTRCAAMLDAQGKFYDFARVYAMSQRARAVAPDEEAGE